MEAHKIFTRDFLLSFFAQFGFSSVFFSLIPTIPIYLSRSGATEAEIGVLVGVASVSSLVLRPFIGRALLKITEKKLMIAGALLLTLSSISYLFSPPFFPFFTVRVFQGISTALFYTASFTLVANISPDTHRGRTLSYFYLAPNIAFALAPSVGMLLINHLSFAFLFWACTGLSLCTLFTTTKLKERPIDSREGQSMKDQGFLDYKTLPPAIMASLANVIWGAITAFFPLYALSHGVTNPGLFFACLCFYAYFGSRLWWEDIGYLQ